MSLEDANKYLPQVSWVVESIEPTVRLEVGVQSGSDPNLHFKVFKGDERWSDFELFNFIPNETAEASKVIERAFAKYASYAEIIA